MIRFLAILILFIIPNLVFALSDAKMDEIYSKAHGFNDRNKVKMKKFMDETKQPGYKRPSKPRVLKRWLTKEKFLAAARAGSNPDLNQNQNQNTILPDQENDKFKDDVENDAQKRTTNKNDNLNNTLSNQTGKLKTNKGSGSDTQWQTVGPLGPDIRIEEREKTPEEIKYEKEKEEYLKQFKKNN